VRWEGLNSSEEREKRKGRNGPQRKTKKAVNVHEFWEFDGKGTVRGRRIVESREGERGAKRGERARAWGKFGLR